MFIWQPVQGFTHHMNLHHSTQHRPVTCGVLYLIAFVHSEKCAASKSHQCRVTKECQSQMAQMVVHLLAFKKTISLII